jgi:hypothetical protein
MRLATNPQQVFRRDLTTLQAHKVVSNGLNMNEKLVKVSKETI